MGTFYKKIYLIINKERSYQIRSFFVRIELLSILYSLGILQYFYFKTEPQIFNLIIITFVFLLLSWLRKDKQESFIYILSLVFSAGVIIAKLNHIDFPKLEKNISYINLSGKIEKIEDLPRNKKILLSNLSFSEKMDSKIEKIIFFVKKFDGDGLNQGDIINVDLNLRKYSFPITPTKNYLNILQYYDHVGAVGFAYSKPILEKRSEDYNIFQQIEKFRKNFDHYVKSKADGDGAAIISALSIGERGNISEKMNNDIRNSGLSHLLSISGMHLSIVVGIFFLASRHIINIISMATNDFNSKKIAAYFSILGSLGYLLISGMKIATIRACIMSNIGLLAVITGNFYNLTRAIFLSMIALLSFKPVYILSAAFQLSFAAVISIDAYLRINKKKHFNKQNFNLLEKLLSNLANNAMFTIASTIGGFWICIFHFYQFPNYSVLSNLLAVPLTSLIIMPLIIITIFSFSFSCALTGNFAMVLLKYAVGILAKISNIIGNLPYSISYFGEIPGYLAILGIFSWLIIVLFPRRNSYILSLIINLICFFLVFCRPKPDLILDSEANNVIIIENKEIFYTNNSYSSFKKKT